MKSVIFNIFNNLKVHTMQTYGDNICDIIHAYANEWGGKNL